MGKISGSHCLVLGCRNRQLLNQANTRSYFRFPRDADLCKKWVDFCNRPELYKKYDENGPEYLYKSSRICSDHFQPTDFNNANLFSQGLKKGSIPSVNPATSDSKPNVGNGGGAGGGGSGSSNGAGSPIDEKLLSAAVAAAIPNLHSNLSLMMAAAVAAAAQNQSHNANQLLALPTNLKRSASSMSGGSMVATSQATSGGQATTTTTTPVSSKRNRAVPPLAAPTGALANLIQRQQQIKEQQMKEQQRKAAALAVGGLVNGQVSITPAIFGSGTSPNSNSNGGAISLVTTKKSSANSHSNNNNNNNNVSNHNHNHNHGKLNSSGRGRLEQQHRDHSEYGLNMVDMDMTGGESSEGDSSYQNSADEDFAYHQKLKVAKVEAVIPPSLKSQLTVTPAAANNVTTITTSTPNINNNSIHNVNANGSGVEEINVDYKEKYEQTLKELFACRKIVKNQNKAIQQQQVEIDFLNQLLKEK
ncbi:probable serine/threonine-protein kinase tsuA isoform X2 [Anopheles stephensi]|uniref:Uncharacterized protein n=1 Tax=Anopheles stephensi TaxID=30069 RepID=A0A182YMN4_ANOST|nr:probable serine/threonine-protein kinase tsuA isoform X2 [Anopheles stephensi]XP_035907628.1 probable serine/threonine-protein kinase tsuA isoform X2 [Anopheles stephensi]XP_035907629.1 probable serine/threonine-protein kinase tsuA isoform X2 [Anopheles stephensi]